MSESSEDAAKKKLEELIKQGSGDKEDVIKAAFDAAAQDSRSTLEIVDTPIKDGEPVDEEPQAEADEAKED